MANYAISFRIADNAGSDARRKSLMEAVRKCTLHWEETTSFCLVFTTETLSELEQRLWASDFNPGLGDKMLVFPVTGDAAITRGMPEGPVLKFFFKQLQAK